jgi:hypothetical protein
MVTVSQNPDFHAIRNRSGSDVRAGKNARHKQSHQYHENKGSASNIKPMKWPVKATGKPQLARFCPSEANRCRLP